MDDKHVSEAQKEEPQTVEQITTTGQGKSGDGSAQSSAAAPNPGEDIKEKRAKKVRQEIKEWVKTLAIVLAIGLPLRFFVFQPILVQQTSMLPTLLEGEYMSTFKLGYLLEDKVGITFSAPRQGDVVICHFPDEKDYFVKRLIGMPGDTVLVKEGVVYLNDIALREPYVVFPRADNYGPITLADDEVFVMGDNREVSKDSRHVGPLKRSMLVGHVTAVIWPPSGWRGIPTQSGLSK